MSIVIEPPASEEAQETAHVNQGAGRVNAATIALIKQWEEEDAKLSPEELKKANRIYEEIEKNGIPRISI